jgi:hypothetical protein
MERAHVTDVTATDVAPEMANRGTHSASDVAAATTATASGTAATTMAGLSRECEGQNHERQDGQDRNDETPQHGRLLTFVRPAT